MNSAILRVKNFLMVAPSLCAVTVNTNMTTERAMGGFVEGLLDIMKYVGLALAVGSFIAYIIAYRSERDEAKEKALIGIVIGIILAFGLKPVLTLTGLIGEA